MAYIIGLATQAEIEELKKRGWEIEDPPKELNTLELDSEEAIEPLRSIQVCVDSNVYDIMNGPDWEGSDLRRGSTCDGMDAGEISIGTVAGERLVFQSAESSPDGVDYVRIIDHEGEELLYWDSREWEEDPKGVMGAILGAMMCGSLRPEKPREKK